MVFSSGTPTNWCISRKGIAAYRYFISLQNIVIHQVSRTELKTGRTPYPVVTRLLRFWEPRSLKKCGDLMRPHATPWWEGHCILLFSPKLYIFKILLDRCHLLSRRSFKVQSMSTNWSLSDIYHLLKVVGKFTLILSIISLSFFNSSYCCFV